MMIKTATRAVVQVLRNFKNEAVYISPFTVSQQDIPESALHVTGTKLEDWKITHTMVKERWKSSQDILENGNVAGFVRLFYARAFYPDGLEDFEKSRGRLDYEVLGLAQ
jgi:tryptophan synthase beta chain